MAAQLTASDLRTLEQSRRQLVQLNQSIKSLQQSILTTPTLPSLDSINIQANILTNNLQNILTHFNKEGNREVFEKVVAYPSTNFPGREEGKEEALRSLLRKKVEPDVETWIGEGRKAGEEIEDANKVEDHEDITKTWNDISEWFDERIIKYVNEEANAEYTNEEEEQGIENVNTGLKKSYGNSRADDDSDEEDEDIYMDASAKEEELPAVKEKSLGDILRVLTTGQTMAKKIPIQRTETLKTRWFEQDRDGLEPSTLRSFP